MKKITHLLFVISLITLSLIYSCSSDDNVVPEGQILIISGNNMTGVAGEYILDPVIIRVGSRVSPENLIVTGSSPEGGSMIYYNYVTDSLSSALDQNYESHIYLSLGCEIGSQTFDIAIRNKSCFDDPDCPILASTQITAHAQKSETEWNRLCSIENIEAVRKHNGTVYLITNEYDRPRFHSKLLMSADFENWTTLYEFGNRVRHFDILSDGTFIALIDRGFLISSNGISWDKKNEGLPFESEYLIPNQMLVEDSVWFVGFSPDYDASFPLYLPLYRSRDRGETWEELTTPFDNSPILRSLNGTLYAHGGMEIYQSSNSGNNWETLNYTGTLDGNINLLEIDNNNQIIISTVRHNYSDFTTNQKLYQLSTVTNELTQVFQNKNDLVVSSIYEYDGDIYVLGSNEFYIYNGMWETVRGPQIVYPTSIKTRFFLSTAFKYLYVNNPGEYLIFAGNSYANFLE